MYVSMSLWPYISIASSIWHSNYLFHIARSRRNDVFDYSIPNILYSLSIVVDIVVVAVVVILVICPLLSFLINKVLFRISDWTQIV